MLEQDWESIATAIIPVLKADKGLESPIAERPSCQIQAAKTWLIRKHVSDVIVILM